MSSILEKHIGAVGRDIAFTDDVRGSFAFP